MTGIVATVGPASESPKILEGLVSAGVTHFRLNFSHGNHAWHGNVIKNIRETTPLIPIVLDTKGPEMRTGDLSEKIVLSANSWLTLTTKLENVNLAEQIIFVNHAGFHTDVSVGDEISINSGLIIVRVLEIHNTEVVTQVIYPGTLESRQHVNLIGKNVSLPTLTASDREDIEFGLAEGIDIIALSFARDAECIAEVKEICKKAGKPNVKIWAKIENITGYNNREKIAQIADGIMVARGDLGVETPFADLPGKQAELVLVCQKHGIFCVVATEMMESMIGNPRPTRAEITDVAIAVWQGASAVMLSAETGKGKYPVETIKIMRSILVSASESPVKMKIYSED